MLCLLATTFQVTSCASTNQDEAIDAYVYIKESPQLKPYNPMIFGGFVEHFNKQVYGGIFNPGSTLSDKHGFRLDVLEALKELRIPVVRWPGGCFVDSYHWINGVGKNRKPMDDIRWGVIEPNTFGTNEFVEFCHLLGAEPYICHNGLADIQEMADWVAYCNQKEGKWAKQRKDNGYEEPHKVQFWSVGNERGGKEYIERVREGAIAMKSIDSGVKVTCSGTHGAGEIDPYLFERAGDYLDLISIHQYWIHNFEVHQTPNYLDCILLSDEPEKFITAVVHSLDANGKRGKIKLAFDEWNLRSWHHPGFPRDSKSDYESEETKNLLKQRDKSLNNRIYTMADALFSASFLNACLRHSDDVEMANVAPMVNQTGPLYVDSTHIVRRPHFYTMELYANALEKYVVNATVMSDSIGNDAKSIPTVDALVTKGEGNKWVISVVNRNSQHNTICNIKIGDYLPDGKFEAILLTGDSVDAYNDVDNPDRVIPQHKKVDINKGNIELPPHSLTFIQINK